MHNHQNNSDGKPSDQSQLTEPAAAEITPARTGVSRVHGRDLGEVEQDTTSSNTVSNKYNEEIFKPLRWGIDSLYVSFKGQLHAHQQNLLSSLKQHAQSININDQALAQIEINEHIFEVKDKGALMFPYIIEDNCFRIQLSRTTSQTMPMAYVKISSEYLTHTSPKETVDDLIQVLLQLGELESRSPNTSRIDLFVDFTSSVNMESWDRHAWVTRASKVNQYSVDGVFSGWAIGMGSTVAARLYNKILEIMISNKAYLVPLWNEAGWDQSSTIWRMEFELKREILSQLKVQDLSLTLDNLNGLWSYLTTEWLKLTLPNPTDKNRSRWDIHPLWQCISSVDFETFGGSLSREFSAQRVPSDQYLFSHGFGVLSSYMAKRGITDFYQGFRAFELDLYNELNNRAINVGVYFDTYVQEQIALKAKRFNSMLNKLNDSAIRRAADEYRRQSDGE